MHPWNRPSLKEPKISILCLCMEAEGLALITPSLPQTGGLQSAPFSQEQQTIGMGQLFGYQNMNMIIHANRNKETPPLQSKWRESRHLQETKNSGLVLEDCDWPGSALPPSSATFHLSLPQVSKLLQQPSAKKGPRHLQMTDHGS